MSFKVLGSLSNVRPSKTEQAQISTTPTSGNIKLNSPAAQKMKLASGDYITVVKAEDSEGVAIYVTKGNAGSEKGATPVVKQVGSVLSGKSGGSLLFSSENAYRELNGNADEKVLYNISDETIVDTYEGEERTFYKLIPAGTEAKVARKRKEA